MSSVFMPDYDPFDDGGQPLPPKKSRGKSDKPKAKRLGPFTTKAAKEWARSQGWRILHSESFDSRLNRTHDAWLASDIVCSIPGEPPERPRTLLLIQAGQKGEERAHRINSDALAEKWAKHFKVKPQDCTLEFVCRQHGWQFLWVEFSRGSKTPDSQVFWVKAND